MVCIFGLGLCLFACLCVSVRMWIGFERGVLITCLFVCLFCSFCNSFCSYCSTYGMQIVFFHEFDYFSSAEWFSLLDICFFAIQFDRV